MFTTRLHGHGLCQHSALTNVIEIDQELHSFQSHLPGGDGAGLIQHDGVNGLGGF
jgi:hypothetical protein